MEAIGIAALVFTFFSGETPRSYDRAGCEYLNFGRFGVFQPSYETSFKVLVGAVCNRD